MELAGGLRALAVRYSAVTFPVSCLVMSERVIVFCFMDTDRATLDDLAILRVAFEDGTPLGWEAGLDGPLLENLTAGSSVAKFYWLIPISASEVAFKNKTASRRWNNVLRISASTT